jgi:hypothetical protein
MEPYLWKTRPDGINVINIGKTWEKIVLAARIIVAIDNPADSMFNPTPEFDMLSSGRILQSIANSSQSVSFLPALTASVPSSSSPPTPVPSPLPVASPPVTSPTTSPVRSRSPVSSSSPTRAPTPRPSRRPHTSTFPSLCVYNPYVRQSIMLTWTGPRRHRLPHRVRRCCHPHQQQGSSRHRSHLVDACP